MIKSYIYIPLLFGLCVIGSLALNHVDVSAADARNFNAGRIIDDSVFTNSSSMSVQDIQNFLNSKMPNCDTYGTGPSSAGGTNRQWLEARGYSPPYKCVKDYRENPSNGQNNYGKSVDPAGSLSSAELIYNYSRQFNINPQVLIVTLQKENGMITDNIPIPKQYSEAMGFGCPDTTAPGAPACDPAYGSFSTQLYQAARHFRGYLNNSPGWWIPYTVGWNSIELKPHTNCGTSDVYIENRSTVALYSYTPYVPNQAAKNAQYGLGDGCSSYGNRNFYLYFTDWFGSTHGSLSVSAVDVTRDAVNQTFTGKPVTVSFTAKNLTQSSFSFKSIGIAVRGPSGINMDPGWDNNITVAPGATYTYKKTFNPTVEGEYQIYLSSYASNDSGWRECEINMTQNSCHNPIIIQNPIVITATPTITRHSNNQAINELRQQQAFDISYTLKNTSNLYTAKPGNVMIAGRSNSGANRDLVAKSAGVLNPGLSYVYTSGHSFSDAPGTKYKFYISTTKDSGKTYEEQQFVPASGSVKQEIDTTMKSGITLVQGPRVADVENAVVGGKVTVTLKVRNFSDKVVDLGRIGVTVRGPQGQNSDPLWQRVDSLSSETNDGVYTYEAQFTPQATGNWSIGYMHTTANYTAWDDSYPLSEDNSVQRMISLPVKEGVTLLQGPQITGNVHAGQPITVTMKLKTRVLGPIDLGRIGVTVRGPQGQNSDPLWQRVDSLSSETNDGVYTYEAQFTPQATGNWSIGYMHTTANYTAWDANRIASDSSSVKRSVNIDVLPQATVISDVLLSAMNTGIRQVSFKVKNFGNTTVNLGSVGVAVRDPEGYNRDPLWMDFTAIPANSEKTYTASINLNKKGNWTFQVTSFKNGIWSSALPVAESESVKTQLTATIN